MWCGAGPLAVVAAVFWTQCVLLDGVDAKKERKRLKEATPQHTETYNATLSNSEEVGGSIKVVAAFLAASQTALLLLLVRLVLVYTINYCMDLEWHSATRCSSRWRTLTL